MAAHCHVTGPDHVALVEIDLTGELMIAAASASEDRLSADRIDEVLDVAGRGDGGSAGRRAERLPRRPGPAGRRPR